MNSDNVMLMKSDVSRKLDAVEFAGLSFLRATAPAGGEKRHVQTCGARPPGGALMQ